VIYEGLDYSNTLADIQGEGWNFLLYLTLTGGSLIDALHLRHLDPGVG
jgi:hypothetical protein